MIQFESAIQSMDDADIIQPPENMSETGERMRRLYAKARSGRYVDLTISQLRKLPFAYWKLGQSNLIEVEPELVRQYWEIHLPQALQQSPRNAKLWLAPLLFVYADQFGLDDPTFADFASRIISLLPRAQGLYANWLFNLQSEFQFFQPLQAPTNLAQYFFSNANSNMPSALGHKKLWPSFMKSALGRAIFKVGLMLPIEKIRNEYAVRNIMDCSRNYDHHPVRTSYRIHFAHAVLEPWYGHEAADSVKTEAIEYFIHAESYGNPRYPAKLEKEWANISPKARGVILSWLTWYALHSFMSLLQESSEPEWIYRKKFWMAYYRRGYIDKAWMILGEQALVLAQKLSLNKIDTCSGRLQGTKDSKQSVLLLQIGDLIFVDWHHNEGVKVHQIDSSYAPQLHLRAYNEGDLKHAISISFGEASVHQGELRYINSKGGGWQRKVRDLIFKRTEIYLEDSEILI